MEESLISIKDDEGKASAGKLFFTAYSAGARTKRAVLAWAGCWAAAGVTVFIPIAHFFLVPAFAIAGPVLFYTMSRQAAAMDHVEGQCPRCNEQISIALESTDKLPKWTYCPKCDGSLQLTED